LRPGLLVLTLLLAASAYGEDARVKILKKQLSSAKDARLRAQVCTLLGKTASPDAVAPLCDALNDGDALVRSAAAGGLGELKAPDGVTCLKSAKDDPDSAVRKAVELALAANRPPGGLYVAIDLSKSEVNAGDVLGLARDLLKKELAGMGATLAPEGETDSQASAAISKGNFKGYLLQANLKPNGSTGLKLEILIMTYPGKALQGTWNVKAAGGKHEAQLKAMVPKVVTDAAYDLDWK
jgi:HEAT repeat protein